MALIFECKLTNRGFFRSRADSSKFSGKRRKLSVGHGLSRAGSRCFSKFSGIPAEEHHGDVVGGGLAVAERVDIGSQGGDQIGHGAI